MKLDEDLPHVVQKPRVRRSFWNFYQILPVSVNAAPSQRGDHIERALAAEGANPDDFR